MFRLDFSNFRKVDFFGLPLYIDPKYNYIAMASHGVIYGFMNEPVNHTVEGNTGFWYVPGDNATKYEPIADVKRFIQGDWRETLIAIDKSNDL